MAKINAKPKRSTVLRPNSHETHGGAPAAHITVLQQLRRSVMSCLLWEDEHYEDGEKVADRIAMHAAEVMPAELARVAVEARHVAKLRHVPLWLLVTLLKTAKGQRQLIVDTINDVIQRADEPGELLAMYWKANGKDAPLSNPLKLGLAKSLLKFDAYQLAKYARQGDVRLRDVMFLTHANPKHKLPWPDQEILFKKLADDELTADDAGTWEAKLSAGADKRETFEGLLREGKLGYLALLRNLRNMVGAGCDAALIKEAICARRGADRVLPFRFIAAARYAPQFEDVLNESLLDTVATLPRLSGRTVVLVDVSGSMDRELSGKSDLTRIDAACTLASIVPAGAVRVLSFSNNLVDCGTPIGIPGIGHIKRSQPHLSTKLFEAVEAVNQRIEYDRLIVISDEQATYGYSHGVETDRFPAPKGRAYMINVASARNGVGYGKWVHIDGFSENVIRYIQAYESAE